MVLVRRSDGAWSRPSVPERGERVALRDLPADSRFDSSALQTVAESLVQALNRRGIYGVWAAIDGVELSGGELIDFRPEGEATLKIVVWASQVAEIRTLARGDRFRREDPLNRPKHRWIVRKSPLQAPAGDSPVGSLLERQSLETYLRDLSAHPGRRVEASIASAGQPGLIVLDYLVNESKAWQVFSQFSNTGTEATSVWRGRVGFQHTQLTNHDDVLNMDVVSTPDFGNTAAFMSYRWPIIRPGTLSVRAYGSRGDFAADGQAFDNLRFLGDNWLAGAEIAFRHDLWKGWDAGVNLGANYTVYSVATTVSGANITEGESPFLVPFLNLAVTRESDWWSIAGGLRLEHSVESVPDPDLSSGYPALGRNNATQTWTSARWAVNVQSYLEPWFAGAQGPRTLAHEVQFRARGRFLLGGERLVPQEQDLLGGAFSVRGYPESVASADESILLTGEYAFHLPRVFRSGEPVTIFGKPFAWRPPAPQRRPDWDFIVRLFTDYGLRYVNPAPVPAGSTAPTRRPLIERDLTLFSAGGGVELTVKQNVSLRCDVGMALADLKDSDTTLAEAGDVRAHVVASFYW